jgi:hypothetical protein
MAMAPMRLWQLADHRKVLLTDEEDRVDLDEHGRCVVAQRKDVNTGLAGSKLTW